MGTKYVIFVFIPLLVAAIYSATATNYVSAKISRTCTTAETALYWMNTCCTVTTDDKTGDVISSKCETTVCSKSKDGLCSIGKGDLNKKVPNTDILKNNGVLQENETKAPNTDILKDNTTLQENNDDGKEPKAPQIPDDLGGLNDDGG